MHITPTSSSFQNTTNKIVRQLGVVGPNGKNLETLDQLQLSTNQSTGQAAYELERTVKLVRAQGNSEVSNSKARNRYLVACGTAALGVGMMASGNLPLALGGVAVALSAFIPLALGTECSKSELRVLTEERLTSYKDGMLTKDEFFYSPKNTTQYKEEAFHCAQGYARRANEHGEWLLASS